MYNWSVDLTKLRKNRKKYTIWKLEQLVNFGLGKQKLNKKQLLKYWPFLQLDPKKKKFLSLLLWK